jgi:hypothetical protein
VDGGEIRVSLPSFLQEGVHARTLSSVLAEGIAAEAASYNRAETRERLSKTAQSFAARVGRAFRLDAFRHLAERASRLKPLPTTEQKRGNGYRRPRSRSPLV